MMTRNTNPEDTMDRAAAAAESFEYAGVARGLRRLGAAEIAFDAYQAPLTKRQAERLVEATFEAFDQPHASVPVQFNKKAWARTTRDPMTGTIIAQKLNLPTPLSDEATRERYGRVSSQILNAELVVHEVAHLLHARFAESIRRREPAGSPVRITDSKPHGATFIRILAEALRRTEGSWRRYVRGDLPVGAAVPSLSKRRTRAAAKRDAIASLRPGQEIAFKARSTSERVLRGRVIRPNRTRALVEITDAGGTRRPTGARVHVPGTLIIDEPAEEPATTHEPAEPATNPEDTMLTPEEATERLPEAPCPACKREGRTGTGRASGRYRMRLGKPMAYYVCDDCEHTWPKKPPKGFPEIDASTIGRNATSQAAGKTDAGRKADPLAKARAAKKARAEERARKQAEKEARERREAEARMERVKRERRAYVDRLVERGLREARHIRKTGRDLDGNVVARR